MSAKISSLLVTLCIVAFGAGLDAQDRGDVFTVGFPNEVVVGDKVLPMGLWDIRWEESHANPTLKFYRGNVLNAEIAAVSITAEDNKKARTSEAVIEKIGPDYHLTHIWIKGERTGYTFRMNPQIASFQHGDVQRIPATFASGSWFAQNAGIEGQARSHVAQGLGNPDDRHPAGVVVARTFTPALPESDVAAQIPLSDASTLPDDQVERLIAGLDEERAGDALAQSESPLLSEDGNSVDGNIVDGNIDESERAEALPVTDETTLNREADVQGLSEEESLDSPEPQPQEEIALNRPDDPDFNIDDDADSIDAESNIADSNIDVDAESNIDSEEQSPEELAGLTASEQAEVVESARYEPQEFEGLPEALPATASYWAAFLLLGFAMVGLSFLVRRTS